MDFTYAVALIRANEYKLLSSAAVEQLITAENIEEAFRILEDKGWRSFGDYDDYTEVLKLEAEDLWSLIADCIPDKSLFDFLLVRNDFHNLKVALKGLVSNAPHPEYCLTPSICLPEEVHTAVMSKNFDELPVFLRKAAYETYDLLSRTMDGQLADIVIDRMTLEAMQKMVKKTDSETATELTEIITAATDIRTALRGIRTKKERFFFEDSIADCKTLDKEELIKAAMKSEEEFFIYLESTKYSDAAAHIKESNSSFEKWTDDILMEVIDSARYKSMGLDPLIAYYISKTAEIKTVRIILSAKNIGLPYNSVRERVRKLYV